MVLLQSTDKMTSQFTDAKTALEQALAYEQLVLYYQPQIKLETGEVSGIEALVRWNHPQFGLISPDKFIPIAEENNLMDALGQWVLTTACRQNKTWQDQGLSPLTVSVNLSPSQVQDLNLRDLVSQALKTSRLAPRWLELEITEDAIFCDPEMTHQVLCNLKQLGVHLCLDDFGNGYSSIYYLSTFPFGTLKISQSCLKNLAREQDYQKIPLISAILAVGKSLDLRVVAEGVETQQQIDLLRNLGCEEVQGYIFSQPLTVKEANIFFSLYC